MKTSGFYAYPASSPLISGAISEAIEMLSDKGIALRPWEAMRIFGFKLDNLVREQISGADVLVADITYANANVFYEIGYAIAVGKPVIPTLNLSVEKAAQRAQKTGLFDTIGWATYENSQQLSKCLEDWPAHAWTSSYVRQKNHAEPMFILDTLVKLDFRNHIFQTVENSHVQYRSYDPSQNPRLTASHAISDVSASSGVIVPFLSDEIVDAQAHNLRGSFVLGLCHGYGIEALAIQYGNGPAPLDYRDFITNSTFKRETESHVEKFAAEVLIWNQKSSTKRNKKNTSVLNDIYLGSPTAENETQTLPDYFVQTAEYSRAKRAEGAVVIGRKGSGKSAIFQQISDGASNDVRNCIIDLRPASHNLSEMREVMLGVLSAGVFDHTIAAFWQYIMYMEIVLKLREIALPKARNNFSLQAEISELEDEFSLTDSVVSGDFTSRLETAVRSVIEKISSATGVEDIRSKLTNIMFEQPIPKLRDAVVRFSEYAQDIIVLIDDLDKGWPPRQVEKQDVMMIKHLIEVLNRIQRDVGKRDVNLRHLIFLRSDIYERLVEQTSDRGKYNVIKVDWSDPEQLRNLIRRRVENGVSEDKEQAAWTALNADIGAGQDAIGVMIESSLRRPRFLIDLCERTLSVAINRGHAVVEDKDVEDGMRQMSLYLVSDFGYELRDIAGTPEDIFYNFIGAENVLSPGELAKILEGDKLGIGFSETVELLLWYGFLGIIGNGSEPRYIYDFAYDFRRLEAEQSSLGDDLRFAVNPAFLMGLEREPLKSL